MEENIKNIKIESVIFKLQLKFNRLSERMSE